MAIVLSFLLSYQEYQKNISFLGKELDSIVRSNKSFIERSLWILDTRALALVIKGITLNNNIVFSQIADENGKAVVSHGIPNNGNIMKRTVPLYHRENGKEVFLGTLTIEASKRAAFRKARSLILVTLFQSALLMLILAAAIIFLFHNLVSRHLVAIQRYTRSITPGERHEPLTLDRPVNAHTKDDELSSMVDAVNLMCRHVLEAYQNLEKQTSDQIRLEQQLHQAQKMESIGRLAGGVAHDFNNVLSVIIGYSGLLLDQVSSNDPMYKKIKAIHDSGEKAATLTRQLLTFSRKQALEKKVVSINVIIRDFLKILGKMVGEDIVFATSLSEEGCTIEADPGQIEQVLMNLIVNARDAMPGGGEIIIETAEVQLDDMYADKHMEVKPGRYVLLIVSDTGEGMDEETMSMIFDPFFTTKEQGKGTGLGLATVYGIVKKHNGYIYVYSEKNKGTTFKVYLPATEKQAEDAESESLARPSSRGNETILIVDDSPSISRLIEETLKPLGYNCLRATSSKEALDITREYGGEIHLLLTDVVMPHMNGRELAEAIRKERSGIKVIFMSGYSENIISHHGALEQGINFISKPITPVALTRKINSVLHNEKGR